MLNSVCLDLPWRLALLPTATNWNVVDDNSPIIKTLVTGLNPGELNHNNRLYPISILDMIKKKIKDKRAFVYLDNKTEVIDLANIVGVARYLIKVNKDYYLEWEKINVAHIEQNPKLVLTTSCIGRIVNKTVVVDEFIGFYIYSNVSSKVR